MNYHIQLIATLLEVYRQYEWYGWEKGGPLAPPYESAYEGGVFTAFETNMCGFVITIREHDYRDNNKPHRGVFGRRGLDREKDHMWVELEVTDGSARFGRKTILQRTVFLPETPEYVSAKKLFEAIKCCTKVFKKGKDICIPENEAVIEMINILSARIQKDK